METPIDSELTTSFSPFRDYLGLSGLLARLHGPTYSPGPLASTADQPGRPCQLSSDGLESLLSNKTGEEDVFLDFTKNGVDAQSDEGRFLPFSVASTTSLRPKCLLVGQGRARQQFCVFCKNNGEAERVYESHVLKDGNGKTTCPVLRAYTCPICGQNGDLAHTIKYCHLNDAAPLSPLKTARTSTGRRRPTSRWSVI